MKIPELPMVTMEPVDSVFMLLMLVAISTNLTKLRRIVCPPTGSSETELRRPEIRKDIRLKKLLAE